MQRAIIYDCLSESGRWSTGGFLISVHALRTVKKSRTVILVNVRIMSKLIARMVEQRINEHENSCCSRDPS
jgi:hypothetical protein